MATISMNQKNLI